MYKFLSFGPLLINLVIILAMKNYRWIPLGLISVYNVQCTDYFCQSRLEYRFLFSMWKLVVFISLQSFDQIYLYSSFNFLNSSIHSLIQRILMKYKQCILNLFYILTVRYVLCEKGDQLKFDGFYGM